jgi:WD40 repeat protein
MSRNEGGREAQPAPAPPPDRETALPAGTHQPDASPATRSASPSTAEYAETRAPSPAIRHAGDRSSAAAQHRDPDRYLIIGEHGRGGLGRVSRAHDRDLGRDVAIKELISRGNISEIRFLREALITARLEHPGIVPVHEAGRWPDGTPFYAMKLVAGRPLRDLITERTTVAERIGLLHHVIAVADAIAYAHGRNIIHRDLKPANVIVGDFGETVVIDWGLAKDLSTAEEASLAAGPFRANRDDDLTAAGSVLGTPAYMAPEQERGEHVDQRADVFAIGAMLWELCSLQKVPPTDPRLRHRMLRRAGVDRDLATIIDKALAPEPSHRYPHAGALAADLKAFKAGARIGARSYSLLALLAHWTRRHRVLAVSAAAATILSVIGAGLYGRNIAIEREVAESAKSAAVEATAVTAVALAEQTLGHAELLLNSDPSAASDLLQSYQGQDQFRLSLLRAQARGRGIARMRATPHIDSVIWIRELPSGAIATLSIDGSLAITTSAGAVNVIARSSAVKDVLAFSEKRSLLAYACRENTICLIDFAQSSPASAGHFTYIDPEGLAFSADAQQLASVSRTGDLAIWNISDTRRISRASTHSARGFSVAFPSADRLVVVNESTITIINESKSRQTVQVRGASNTARTDQGDRFAIGTADGIAILIDKSANYKVVHAKMCEGPLNALRFSDDAAALAYGCKDGKVGLLRSTNERLVTLTTIQGGANELCFSKDGKYLAAGGSSGVISIIDLETRIIAARHGHNGKLSAVTGLDTRVALFATADLNGNLRTWAAPARFAHVAHVADFKLFDLQFVGGPGTLAATGIDGNMRFVESGRIRMIGTHEPNNILLELSPDRDHLASYASQHYIELWSGSERKLQHVIDTNHSEIIQLKFTSATELLYANSNSQLVHWTAATGPTVVATMNQALASFVVLPRNVVIAELRDGTLWRIEQHQTPSPVSHQEHPQERLIYLTQDRRWLATGTRSGDVTVYDTKEWQTALRFRATGQIHHMAISPTDNIIAVAMKSGEVHLGRRSSRSSSRGWDNITWQHFRTQPRFLTFSPSGDLLMITTGDGAIWFYSPRYARWLYLPTSASSLSVLRVETDGHHAATVDSSGRLLLIDLQLVRRSLSQHESSTPTEQDL